MKIFIILLMACSIVTCDVIAQQRPPGVILKSVRRGEPLPEEAIPAPESERFKMSWVAPKDTSNFEMYLWEYVEGERVDEFSRVLENVYTGQFSKGNRLTWEVVPDIVSTNDTLGIFIYFPGMTARRLKIPEKGKCFKYAPYRLMKNTGRTGEVPLMLFYEDNIATGETEKLIKRYMTDGKLNPDVARNKLLLSKINRYSILLYVLN
jgi:hypothetical protein